MSVALEIVSWVSWYRNVEKDFDVFGSFSSYNLFMDRVFNVTHSLQILLCI